MNNFIVTMSEDINDNGIFLGLAKWQIEVVDVCKLAPVEKKIWDIVLDTEARVIVDARQMSNVIATILYARYIYQADKTFILLTPQQEEKFIWGYGASVYSVDDNIEHYKMLRLWRDIEFYFEQTDKKITNEPVREFLESYWSGAEFGQKKEDIDIIDFEKIDELECNRGEKILERLKEKAIQDDLEEFKKELKSINNNNNLDYHDYLMIGSLCREMDLKLYRVSIMERGYKRWKENIPELLFGLIDAYIDSPNISHREKALDLVKEYFGISNNDEGKIEVGKNRETLVIQENFIKSLLNAYISLEKYDELQEVINQEDYFVEKANDVTIRNLFMRNRAICMKESGDNKGALQLFLLLYEKEATENTVNLIAETYESVHKYDMSAKLQLAVILRKYGKLDAILRLAKTMLNNSIVFTCENEWKKVSDITEDVGRQVIPLLMFVFSFEKNQDNQEIIYDIYKMFEKYQDKEAMNFLLENKRRLAYIWNDFKGMADNQEKYDFKLVGYIQSEYERIHEESISIDKYIQHILECEVED